MFKIFKVSLPIKLIFILLFCLFFGHFINEETKSLFYTFSLIIKEILIFIIPFIIFSYLFACLMSFQKGTASFIILLFIAIFISNISSLFIAYSSSNIFINNMNIISTINSGASISLKPLISMSLPKLISNKEALLASFIVGCLFSYLNSHKARNIANLLKQYSTLFLNKVFVPIVPLFILGFILKLEHEGTLIKILTEYQIIFSFILLLNIIYIVFLYGLGARFKLSKWIMYVKNILPATITGFSTMSSLVSMPLTLDGTQKSTGRSNIAEAVIPATVNIHLIGDCLTISILAISILTIFGHPFPNFVSFAYFALYFSFAILAVATVPGGGIIIMLPILEQHLGFSPEMLSLITAIYIIFDPINTAANVTGNGAFAIIFTNLFKKVVKHQSV